MSLDAASLASIDQEIQILSKKKTTQHLTHAQARGIVKLFNYYFKQRDSSGRIKRLSKSEKARRWRLYKIKVYHQYHRLIKSEFPSEAALVKRYSDPLSFLKYRLKRYRNLKVSDLSREDQEYYKEIGGLEDVEAMRQRQANIDSISKSEAKAFQQSSNVMDVEENDVGIQLALLQEATNANHNSQNHNHNHNRNPQQQRQRLNTTNILNIESLPPQVPIMPELSQATQIVTEPKLDVALEQVYQNFNEFEREQLEKKKDTAIILTKQKTKAFLEMVTDEISNKPQLLGFLPGVTLQDQLIIGFQTWIFDNLNKIIQHGYNKQKLVQQLSVLKGANVGSLLFLQQWKLQRIIFEDDFNLVWKFVTKQLKILRQSEKEELDDIDSEEEEKTDEL